MSCQIQLKFDGHPKSRMGILDARAGNCVDVGATCEWRQVEGAKDTVGLSLNRFWYLHKQGPVQLNMGASGSTTRLFNDACTDCDSARTRSVQLILTFIIIDAKTSTAGFESQS
jgi:hypothetical protein